MDSAFLHLYQFVHKYIGLKLAIACQKNGMHGLWECLVPITFYNMQLFDH